MKALKFATSTISRDRFYLLDLYCAANRHDAETMTVAIRAISTWWRAQEQDLIDGIRTTHFLKGVCHCGYSRYIILAIEVSKENEWKKNGEPPCKCRMCSDKLGIKWTLLRPVDRIRTER